MTDLFGRPRESWVNITRLDSGLPKMPDAKNRATRPHRDGTLAVTRGIEAAPAYLPVRPIMVKRLDPGSADGAHSTFRKGARAISGDASCGKAAALGMGEVNHTRTGILQSAVAEHQAATRSKARTEVEVRRLNISWVAEPRTDKTVPGARGKFAPR
jgi:hypothetical protein